MSLLLTTLWKRRSDAAYLVTVKKRQKNAPGGKSVIASFEEAQSFVQQSLSDDHRSRFRWRQALAKIKAAKSDNDYDDVGERLHYALAQENWLVK